MFIPSMVERYRYRQSGISLIELVMFIIIIGVGLSGILSVMNITTIHSADPQLRKQALSIAEGLLEEIESARFTYCDPADANAETAANTASCASIVENAGPEASNTRPYDNVNDYISSFGTTTSYTTDLSSTSFPAGYSATVLITPEVLNGIGSISIVPANVTVLRITVMVTYNGGNDSITLDGYRTRYAPNLMP